MRGVRREPPGAAGKGRENTHRHRRLRRLGADAPHPRRNSGRLRTRCAVRAGPQGGCGSEEEMREAMGTRRARRREGLSRLSRHVRRNRRHARRRVHRDAQPPPRAPGAARHKAWRERLCRKAHGAHDGGGDPHRRGGEESGRRRARREQGPQHLAPSEA